MAASASADRSPSPLLAPVIRIVRPVWSGMSPAVHFPIARSWHRPAWLTTSVERPQFRITATVLGSADAQALAGFYQLLLGWERHDDFPGWVRLRHPSGDLLPSGLSFQEEAEHQRPVWPSTPTDQQMHSTSTSPSTTSKPASSGRSSAAPRWPSTSRRTTSA